VKYLAQIADLNDILCKFTYRNIQSRSWMCVLNHCLIEHPAVSGTNSLTWSVVEPGTAITAASLVTIRPLLRKLNIAGFKSSNATSSRLTQTQNTNLRSGLQSATGNAQSSNDAQRQKNAWTSVQALKRNTGVHSKEVSDGGSEEYILEGIVIERTTAVTDEESSSPTREQSVR
jgi:hypothetical protein